MLSTNFEILFLSATLHQLIGQSYPYPKRMLVLPRMPLLAVALVFCSSCYRISTDPLDLTEKQAAYLDRAMQQPLTFEIPHEFGGAALRRAQGFIKEYSSSPVSLTILSIETSKPIDSTFGYSVVLKPHDRGLLCEVSCYDSSGSITQFVQHNAHILAYYVNKGDWPNPTLVYRDTHGGRQEPSAIGTVLAILVYGVGAVAVIGLSIYLADSALKSSLN